MVVHSFHLAQVRPSTTARLLAGQRSLGGVVGLRHVERFATMRLGAPIISPDRLQLTRLALFAEWDDEDALDRLLVDDPLGRVLVDGWHVRLDFLRRWGSVGGLDHIPSEADPTDPDEPVVAVTLARAKLPQLPRFIRWGRPVERLVRDHPGVTLALAAMRPPRTFSTFSVWSTATDMIGMVHGDTDTTDRDRHAVAMHERDRKDFHHEFTTLRFRCRSEHGAWEGRTGIVPG